MCLAIPGKVLQIENDVEPKMGKVSFGGVVKRVCLEWVPDIAIGEYVIVHVGFAISKVNEEEALETIRLFQEMADGLDELNEGEQPVSSPEK